MAVDTTDQLYCMCKHCDHFVSVNPAAEDAGPWINSVFIHEDDGDQAYDHDPEPGPVATGYTWATRRPDLFCTYPDDKVGPNSRFHSRRGKHDKAIASKPEPANLEEIDDDTPFYCTSCDQVGTAVDFAPTDGTPVDFICFNCRSLSVFPMLSGGKIPPAGGVNPDQEKETVQDSPMTQTELCKAIKQTNEMLRQMAANQLVLARVIDKLRCQLGGAPLSAEDPVLAYTLESQESLAG